MIAALLAAALQATAATPAPVAPVTAPTPATLTRVQLTTAAGPIVIGVNTRAAPATAANFLKYVDQRKLDGVAFYRAVKVGDGYGLVQFGTRNDPKTP